MLRRFIVAPRTMVHQLFLLLLLNAYVIADHHPRLRRQVFDFSSNTPAPTGGSADLSGGGAGSTGGTGGLSFPSLSGSPVVLPEGQNNNDTGESYASAIDLGSLGLGGSSGVSGGNTFNFPDPNPTPTNVGGVLPFPNLNQNANNSGEGVSVGWPLAPTPNDSNSSTPTGIGGVSFLPSLDRGSASNNDSDNGTNTGTGQGDFSLNCSPLRFLLCQSWSCVNGGTCDVRVEPGTFNCKPFCHCPAPFNDTTIYDDLHCKEKDEDNVTTTVAPQRPCPLPCGLHGECRWRESPHTTNSLFCHCDAGWVGHSCSTPCAKNCSNNATCDVYEGVERKH